MKTTRKDYIDSIVNKLYNEGICKSNYTKESATAILQECVAPNLCVSLLNEFEENIVKLLPL